MESLVFYKQLLLRRHAQRLSDTERVSLTQDCLRLLGSLQEVDPSRRHRYEDQGRHAQMILLPTRPYKALYSLCSEDHLTDPLDRDRLEDDAEGDRWILSPEV